MRYYIIRWTTGDTDRCYGYVDLCDLLNELGYTRNGNNVMDGTRIAGLLVTLGQS